MFNVSVLFFSVFQSFRLPTIIARSDCFFCSLVLPLLLVTHSKFFPVNFAMHAHAHAHTQLQVKKNDQRPGSVTLQLHRRGNTAMKGLGSDWTVSSSITARLFLLRVRRREMWGVKMDVGVWLVGGEECPDRPQHTEATV